MNSTLSMTSTTISNNDDINGSLADDWENYKAYTRFYYITDEVFLYANPILIIIGKYFFKDNSHLIGIFFFE
jgi:hypothetical protein